MRFRFRRIALASLASMLVVAAGGCESQPRSESAKANRKNIASPNGRLGPRPLVAVSLPYTNRVAFVDPRQIRATYSEPFPESAIEGPSGLLRVGNSLVVVGTGGDGLLSLDLETGNLRSGDGGVGSDPLAISNSYWSIAGGLDGYGYVAVDGLNGGSVLRINPQRLTAGRRIEIGPEPSTIIVEGEVAWVTGTTIRLPVRTALSRVQLTPNFSSITYPLLGAPEGITAHRGQLYIALRDRAEIVQVDPPSIDERRLKIRRRVKVGPSPWGIASRDGRLYAVTSADSVSSPSLYVIDAKHMRVIERISLGDYCPDARELVLIEKRAVVTCAALPGVTVVDLAEKRVVGHLVLAEGLEEVFLEFEQPRNPVLID